MAGQTLQQHEKTDSESVKHPGEVLYEEFMSPLGLSATRLASTLQVSAQRISQILSGERAVSLETALRLSRYFNTSAKYWLDLQMNYELSLAEDELLEQIEREVQPIDKCYKGTKLDQGPETKSAETKSAGGSGVKFGEWRTTVPKRARGKMRSDAAAEPVLPEITDPIQKQVFELLSEGPVHLDVLVTLTGLPVGELSGALTMLRLSEHVNRSFGDYYSQSSHSLKSKPNADSPETKRGCAVSEVVETGLPIQSPDTPESIVSSDTSDSVSSGQPIDFQY